MKILETKAVILVVLVAVFAFLGSYITVVIPLADDTLNTPTKDATDYTDLQMMGKEIYQSEGCWYCHTQQIRNLVTVHRLNTNSMRLRC